MCRSMGNGKMMSARSVMMLNTAMVRRFTTPLLHEWPISNVSQGLDLEEMEKGSSHLHQEVRGPTPDVTDDTPSA